MMMANEMLVNSPYWYGRASQNTASHTQTKSPALVSGMQNGNTNVCVDYDMHAPHHWNQIFKFGIEYHMQFFLPERVDSIL